MSLLGGLTLYADPEVLAGDVAFLLVVLVERWLRPGFFRRHFWLPGGAAALALAWRLTDDYIRTRLPPLWDVGAWNLLRTRNASNAGHVLSWIPLVAVMAYSMWVEARGERDFVRTWMIAAYGVALHEGAWYAFYFVANPATLPRALVAKSPFLALLALGFAGTALLYPRLFRAGKWPLATLVLYDSMWLAFGFPVSLSLLSGPTAVYASQFVGGLENGGWLVFGAVFAWAVVRYYRGLRRLKRES